MLTGGSDGLVTLTFVITNGGAVNVVSGAAGIKFNSNIERRPQYLGTNGGNLTLTGNVLLETYVTLDTSLTEASSPTWEATCRFPAPSMGTARRKAWFSPATTERSAWAAIWAASSRISAAWTCMATWCSTADRTITVQNYFELDTGLLDIGSHTLTVDTGNLYIGDGYSANSATLTGRDRHRVQFHRGGRQQWRGGPGRQPNTLGTLQIDGSIEFQAAASCKSVSGPLRTCCTSPARPNWIPAPS